MPPSGAGPVAVGPVSNTPVVSLAISTVSYCGG